MASSSGRTGRSWAGTLWVSLTVLLAAGCATMPDSGDPESVQPPQGAGADQGVQVRVIPMPPRDGLSPRAVLQNFLDASVADEADYRTAKQYLTPDGVDHWNPNNGAVVLKSTALQNPVGEDSGDQASLTISSPEIGELDDKHTYRPQVDTQQFTRTFRLVNLAKDVKDGKGAKAQWRIADLPDRLILDQTSFRNAYQQVDRYFFTRTDPATGSDQPVLVPDPVYLRRRIDPASAAARALVDGPSYWLAPAVHSAFDGVPPVARVNTDDPRNPKVQLDGVDCVASERQCKQMAAQLYFTLVSQSGAGSIDRVVVTSRKGSAEMTLQQAKNLQYVPGSRSGGGGTAYARNAQTGQLQLVGSDPPTPVPGVLGAANRPAPLVPQQSGHVTGAFAVSRDGKSAAVVSEDGKSLFIAGLDDSTKQLNPAVVGSHAPRPEQGLTSPSWDGYGGLWVVDRDPAAPQVLLIEPNKADPTKTLRISVPVAGLAGQSGQTVDAVRISSDGTRAALLLRGTGAADSLQIGLVVRGGTAQQPTAEITGLRPIAGQLVDVTSVSWADPDTLLALGKEKDSVLQLHYLSTDGSSGLDGALQAVDGMTVVASSESRLDSVLADANDPDHTVYKLLGNVQSQWKTYGNGMRPAYPG
ncbi:LpqB family beta-propeller domain-containing protein [Kitasatospora azatica]|uniref:LpqB family beta-propeller domain-containing protein n=1 Tax=Kitasatospora azatica TaxID=58347 RepID=UPI00055D2DC5|nr:LpqB family beta-propeller domain-containing protein [Kitasatospora azatica]